MQDAQDRHLAEEFLERLTAAVDARDVDALVDCFHDDYRNEAPAHPDRGFVGSDQVRRNWSRIFATVPDIRQRVLRSAVDGSSVWVELEQTGTRVDGSPHAMAGVAIFGLREGRAQWVRFFMEPRTSGGDVDSAVHEALTSGGPR